MMGSASHTLGILTCKTLGAPPFRETAYFKQLTLTGREWGIQLIVFSPTDVDWNRKSVSAWSWDGNLSRWHRKNHPIPTLIYDRCYYLDNKHYLAYKPYVSKLVQHPGTQLLGRPLGGKIRTQKILLNNPLLRPYLPPTIMCMGPETVHSALKTMGTILIKPNGGSHGRGVAAIFPDDNRRYRIKGRTRKNQEFHIQIQSEKHFLNWLTRFIGSTRYIIQPYLTLCTKDGRPFDLRILVQKGKKGKWETTGSAVRTGKTDSLTSNLHGGGKAERTASFLTTHIPETHRPAIIRSIQLLAREVPLQIEKEHGRLAELGLDIGIDQKYQVWLLEANSKPGRSVFLLTGEAHVRKRSIQLPIQYAYFLLNGNVGGSV